ncbi:2-hydroxychromene-2-carboxylate isomerase [Pseudoxanthomonas putridarboris]|uniref:2-hydroxychromene-2-carboxylate isomerase n=1 Tax=Pseudoxanthomonas putridarboris TaxID=752605 RepID=A0ABU9IYU1_9GAMM
MAAAVDYFFSLASPYAYLGHAAFLQVAQRHGANVRFRPVRMLEVFAAGGGVPLGQRPLSRQRYRLLELQRWREARGLPLNLHPKHFPVDASLADRTVVALLHAGADPADYMLSVSRALWVDDADIADPQALAARLAAHGHDADHMLASAGADAVHAEYRANTEAAIAADLPGVPGYVSDGEAFWGQDRIAHLDDALRNGRTPFRAG